MSVSKNLEVFQNIVDGDTRADITSKVTCIKRLDNIAIQLNATTSDAIGTFTVEASLDYRTNGDGTDGTVVNAGNWVNLGVKDVGGNALELAGANKNILVNLNQVPYPFIRVVYKRTSGGAVKQLQGFITGKAL